MFFLKKIYITCGGSTEISVASNTPSPSRKNLYLIGQAGSVVTGEEPETVIEAANQCNREALSSPDEAAKTDLTLQVPLSFEMRVLSGSLGGAPPGRPSEH